MKKCNSSHKLVILLLVVMNGVAAAIVSGLEALSLLFSRSIQCPLKEYQVIHV